MWGAPTTGKTTFLAALSIALIRRGSAWRVKGLDSESNELLIDLTVGLTKNHLFPDGTIGIAHYRWALDGKHPRRLRRWFFRRRQVEEDVRIQLDLVDPAGILTSSERKERAAQSDLVDNLVRSDAIVFLFDPTREFEEGDTFDHTYGVIEQLSLRTKGVPGQRLPHYVAVCVTKFDEVRVLTMADKLGLVSYQEEPPGFPVVANEDAKELFRELCNVSRSGNGELLLNLLEQNFMAERVKYFVTSAIGFYVDPRKGRFDPDDFQNRVPPEPGEEPRHPKLGEKQEPATRSEARIRGSVYPINVVEPMLWLGQKVAAKAGE